MNCRRSRGDVDSEENGGGRVGGVERVEGCYLIKVVEKLLQDWIICVF